MCRRWPFRSKHDRPGDRGTLGSGRGRERAAVALALGRQSLTTIGEVASRAPIPNQGGESQEHEEEAMRCKDCSEKEWGEVEGEGEGEVQDVEEGREREREGGRMNGGWARFGNKAVRISMAIPIPSSSVPIPSTRPRILWIGRSTFFVV